jgi:hypothetical protein
MLHSSDRQKDFKYETTDDWTGQKNLNIVKDKYYPINDLAKDGFIHADGSLRFEFKIKKHNF